MGLRIITGIHIYCLEIGDRTFTDVTNEKIPEYSQSTNEKGAHAYNVYINDIDNDGDFDLIPDYPFQILDLRVIFLKTLEINF